jgi:hypothetical protein
VGWLELADLARQATEAVLGETATYTAPLGSPVTIVGLFDAAFVRQELQDGVAVENVGPAMAVTLADLPGGAAVREAVVVVRSTSYKVAEIHKDGQGGALLRLHLV